MARPDEHHHDALRAAVGLEGVDRVVGHRGVPRALRREHAVEHLAAHGVHEVVAAREERLEQLLVLLVGEVHLRGDAGRLLGREVLESLLAHGAHDLARRVHAEHLHAVIPREDEDVAVVVPVVAPVLVPARLRDEIALALRPAVPQVEGGLFGVRVHLEADEDVAAARLQGPDHLQLRPVEEDVRVALTHEHHAHVVEAGRHLGGRDGVAGARVGDRVEHHRRLPGPAGGIANLQLPVFLGRRHRRGRHSQGDRDCCTTSSHARFLHQSTSG